MIKSLTDQASGFLGNSKPFSAVSDWIDRLCTERYEEDEYDGIPELVEAINLQTTGPTEASRAIRKKLKYSSVHGQKRSLTILKALVENCGTRFQTTFANERLVDRIKLMSQDPLIDGTVRRKLMQVLLSWHRQFKSDPSMRLVSGLYVACGGGKKSENQLKNEAAEAYRKNQERLQKESQIRMDRKTAERLEKEEKKEKERRDKERRKRGGRPVFNFQQEKPAILSTLATSQQVATALVNALQHVNREKETVISNERVQQYLEKVKVERKKLVRYIQLVQDEEFLGGLISANEQVLLSLSLYDKLASSSVHRDSDDEDDNEPLANISGKGTGTGEGESERQRWEADDKEIELVRKRIAEARLMGPKEGELEKLQVKQRTRLERHNSYMSSRSGLSGFTNDENASRGGAAAGGGAMQDLMDLNFDDNGSDNLPPSMAPSRSSQQTSSGHGVTNSTSHTTLSDFSDYSSSEESSNEQGPSSRSRRPIRNFEGDSETSLPNGGNNDSNGTGGLGWSSGRHQEEDEEGGGDSGWELKYGSRIPEIGPNHTFIDAGDEDPFSDPFVDDNQVENHSGNGNGFGQSYGGNGKGRMEYAAV